MPPVPHERSTRTITSELFQAGRVSEVERQLVCKDGAKIDVVISAITVRDAQGRLPSLSVLEDVTEHNMAPAALVAEHERLCVTQDSIGEAVVTLDCDGNLEYLNPVVRKLTGWSNSEAKSLPVGEVFRLVGEATRSDKDALADSGTMHHAVLACPLSIGRYFDEILKENDPGVARPFMEFDAAKRRGLLEIGRRVA